METPFLDQLLEEAERAVDEAIKVGVSDERQEELRWELSRAIAAVRNPKTVAEVRTWSFGLLRAFGLEVMIYRDGPEVYDEVGGFAEMAFDGFCGDEDVIPEEWGSFNGVELCEALWAAFPDDNVPPPMVEAATGAEVKDS